MITVKIQSTESLGEIRLNDLGGNLWTIEAVFPKDESEIQIFRKSFSFNNDGGNIMALIKTALSTFKTEHLEGKIDGSVSSNLAWRLGPGGSQV